MRLLPNMFVRIRKEARYAVYREACNRSHTCAVGFLLGTEKVWGRPRIEFSLVAATPADYDELWESPERLPLLLPTCQKGRRSTPADSYGTLYDGRHSLW